MGECETYRERVTQKHSGRIEPSAMRDLERHAELCVECRSWESDVLRCESDARALPRLSLAPDFADRVLARSRPRNRPARALSGAAAVLLAAVLAWALFSGPPETAGPRDVAEHLQISRIFFRQLEKPVEPALVQRELAATELEEKTEKLRRSSTSPEVKQVVDSVHHLLGLIRRGAYEEARSELRRSWLVHRLSELTEGDAALVNVGATPASDDPAQEAFFQARIRLYRGEYERATELFQSLEKTSQAGDSAYWQADAFARRGKLVDALRALILSIPDHWRDLETARQVKEIVLKLGATWNDIPAERLEPETIESLLQGELVVLYQEIPGKGPRITVRAGRHPRFMGPIALLKSLDKDSVQEKNGRIWAQLRIGIIPGGEDKFLEKFK